METKASFFFFVAHVAFPSLFQDGTLHSDSNHPGFALAVGSSRHRMVRKFHGDVFFHGNLRYPPQGPRYPPINSRPYDQTMKTHWFPLKGRLFLGGGYLRFPWFFLVVDHLGPWTWRPSIYKWQRFNWMMVALNQYHGKTVGHHQTSIKNCLFQVPVFSFLRKEA